MFLVTVSCVANERRNVFIVLKMAPGGNGFQRLYNDDIWRGTLHFPFLWYFGTSVLLFGCWLMYHIRYLKLRQK